VVGYRFLACDRLVVVVEFDFDLIVGPLLPVRWYGRPRPRTIFIGSRQQGSELLKFTFPAVCLLPEGRKGQKTQRRSHQSLHFSSDFVEVILVRHRHKGCNGYVESPECSVLHQAEGYPGNPRGDNNPPLTPAHTKQAYTDKTT